MLFRTFSAGAGLVFVSCGSRVSGAPPEPLPLPPNAPAAPDGRSAHAMVYDEARGVTVLFGGSGNSMYGDTWTWNGVQWNRAASTGPSPSPRNIPVLVYDAARQRVVLHGGQAGRTLLTDTWEWDGRTWTQKATTGPSPRIHGAGGYDRRRQRVVLFGGSAPDDSTLTDTWEWDGTSWTRAAVTGPDRWANGMAYDAASDRLLLHAIERGRGRGIYPTELYAWSGTGWNLVGTPLSGPSISPTQAIAPLHGGGILLFDGGTAQGTASTWRWSSGTWSRLDVTPPGLRSGHAMALDRARNRVVAFGGFISQNNFRDTWEWNGDVWLEVNR
jgi:hypothetical protein